MDANNRNNMQQCSARLASSRNWGGAQNGANSGTAAERERHTPPGVNERHVPLGVNERRRGMGSGRPSDGRGPYGSPAPRQGSVSRANPFLRSDDERPAGHTTQDRASGFARLHNGSHAFPPRAQEARSPRDDRSTRSQRRSEGPSPDRHSAKIPSRDRYPSQRASDRSRPTERVSGSPRASGSPRTGGGPRTSGSPRIGGSPIPHRLSCTLPSFFQQIAAPNRALVRNVKPYLHAQPTGRFPAQPSHRYLPHRDSCYWFWSLWHYLCHATPRRRGRAKERARRAYCPPHPTGNNTLTGIDPACGVEAGRLAPPVSDRPRMGRPAIRRRNGARQRVRANVPHHGIRMPYRANRHGPRAHVRICRPEQLCPHGCDRMVFHDKRGQHAGHSVHADSSHAREHRERARRWTSSHLQRASRRFYLGRPLYRTWRHRRSRHGRSLRPQQPLQ